MDKIRLVDGKNNFSYEICGYSASSEKAQKRLLELGLTRGQKVKILARSTLSKVFLLEVRGYLLSVRAVLLCDIFVLA